MKSHFFADCYRWLMRGKREVLSNSVEGKYDAELANANPHHRLRIRRRMVEEYLQRGKI